MSKKVCFFFQAGHGIRDSVASRWLGVVYKRQGDAWGSIHCIWMATVDCQQSVKETA